MSSSWYLAFLHVPSFVGPNGSLQESRVFSVAIPEAQSLLPAFLLGESHSSPTLLSSFWGSFFLEIFLLGFCWCCCCLVCELIAPVFIFALRETIIKSCQGALGPGQECSCLVPALWPRRALLGKRWALRGPRLCSCPQRASDWVMFQPAGSKNKALGAWERLTRRKPFWSCSRFLWVSSLPGRLRRRSPALCRGHPHCDYLGDGCDVSSRSASEKIDFSQQKRFQFSQGHNFMSTTKWKGYFL